MLDLYPHSSFVSVHEIFEPDFQLIHHLDWAACAGLWGGGVTCFDVPVGDLRGP